MSLVQSVIDVATRVARREVAAAGVARAGWGTVTGVSPLAVTLDESSSGAMAVTPVSLVDGLAAGDRVWVEHSIRRAVIVGRAGGPRSRDVSSLITPVASSWLTAHTARLTGDVVTVTCEITSPGWTPGTNWAVKTLATIAPSIAPVQPAGAAMPYAGNTALIASVAEIIVGLSSGTFGGGVYRLTLSWITAH